ncbi:hypothetical protein [Actinophytocola oryzae]|uniref:Uncharacterized protein n=1 Tax=Actinophytocola oryzae TaxID=502181 RepID=A0A4R7VN40_9PSEU|nr:hypothetical protein [Actinophytocola oryzae]TDV50679.1 hypothetical protein CLV71_10619 [Actinophytocola oryzae]
MPHEIPATPGRNDIDPHLKGDEYDRVVVHGTDADLAAVVLRLLRTDRVADVPIGFVPTDRAQSVAARVWGLPEDMVGTALTGGDRPLPLVRDDVGGVLVGLGVLLSVHGTVYCDDAVALRGDAGRVEVTPAADGVEVRVVRGRLRRPTVHTGRAVQFGIDGTVPVCDGQPHPRPVTRWTWYRHTEDLRTIR